MLHDILNRMYDLNIQVIKNDENRVLVHGEVPEDLLQDIKKHQKKIIQRLEENEQARSLGITVYHHGENYEYRYGKHAYLFIERYSGNFASAWKEKIADAPHKQNKVERMCQNAPFSKAFKQAVGFVRWMNKKRNS
jgi:flagellar biosynthesis/type III secretory pathway chaperone